MITGVRRFIGTQAARFLTQEVEVEPALPVDTGHLARLLWLA